MFPLMWQREEEIYSMSEEWKRAHARFTEEAKRRAKTLFASTVLVTFGMATMEIL